MDKDTSSRTTLAGKGPVGLVLGSGGARGISHLGVFRVLAERGVRPDIIVGSSIGSIAGALLASGRVPDAERAIETMDMGKMAGLFFEFGLHRDGLLAGRKVMDFIGRLLPDIAIEELPVRFAAVATDIETGEMVTIDRGRLLNAIRASIAIPGVFTPVSRGRRRLVDGGLSSPVPVALARKMGARRVVAVNIDNPKACPYHTVRYPRAVSRAIDFSDRIRERLSLNMPALEGALSPKKPDLGLFDILLKTVRIAEDRIAAAELAATPPDILIEPAVGDIPTLDFARCDDALQAGYDAAVAALPARLGKC